MSDQQPSRGPDLADIEAALDLGLTARDLVRQAGTPRPKAKLREVLLRLLSPLIAALGGTSDGGTPTVGETDYQAAADRLDDYASELGSLVESGNDEALAEHLEVARIWGKRVWEDPEDESSAVVAEIQPTLDRLVELRTELILER